MPETKAEQEVKTSISITVWPVCVCGRPKPEHPHSECNDYSPSRPVQELTSGQTEE